MSRSRSHSHSPTPSRSRSRSRARSGSRSPTRERGTSLYTAEGEVRNPGNQVYVSGLSARCTDADLRERFEKYGTLEEISVVKDPHLNECRGFGFVRYASNEHAMDAIKGEHGTMFMGNLVTVQHSKRNRPRPKTPGKYLGRNPDKDYVRSRELSPPRRMRRDASPYSSRRYSNYSSRDDRSRRDHSRDRYERRSDRDDRRDSRRDRDRHY